MIKWILILIIAIVAALAAAQPPALVDKENLRSNHGSILKGQQVLMADGSQKNIEDVQVGDEVISFNLDSQKIEKDKVIEIEQGSCGDYLIINDILKTSSGHFVWLNGEFKSAKEIKPGDFLLDSDGNKIAVIKMEYVHRKAEAYDLVIKNNHNLFLSNYLVHNKASFMQSHFQIFQDDAGLSFATPYAAEDTNYNVVVNTNFRIRIQVANAGDASGSISRRLEFQEGAGNWTQITTDSNNVRLQDSSNFTDGDPTEQILGFEWIFLAGQGKDTSSTTSSATLLVEQATEDEYCLKFQTGAAGNTYQFRITRSGIALSLYDSTPIITPASFDTATKLGMQTQPGGGTSATAWAQQPVVLIQDASGNTVTTDSSTVVTAAIGTNPASGTLSGTTTATASSGVATFTNLKIDKAGTGYTLNFTSSPLLLDSTTSSAFNITAGSATKIKVETTADGSGTAVPAQNVASGSSLTVYAISRDASDNFVANVAADSWSLSSKTAGVVDGDLVAAGDNKSAVFTGAVTGTAVINATKSGLTATPSGTITVTAVPPVVNSTVYTQADRKLSITFDKTINISTFTVANLANLSIQDGTNTVSLTGASIITAANSTTMEATLTVAEDNALYAIKDNTVRLVVGASCGIKDLNQNELAQNTYATSTYPVTYTAATATPITGTLKDSKSGIIIANAAIKLYDSAGNLRAETTSDTSGNFSFSVNIPSGSYTLTITPPSFFKNKEQTVTITAGTTEAAGDILIDPYGIVYDSITGEAIAGATVTLYTASGNIYTGSPQPNPQSSRADGGYNFDVAPGTYYLGATKDGYANYTGATFTVTTDIVEWNIPMIPNNQSASTYLSIIKQANKKVATAGDIITYTINIKNLNSTLAASSVTVTDNLPHGFKYIPGSTSIDGVKAADPTGTNSLSWSPGNLSAQATKKITYRVRVGPDAKIGKNENSARVQATVGGSATSAGPSVAGVEVREGLFSDNGMVMGKVFEDKNGNGIQDKDEPGIPNVSLILEDGTVIVTDQFGRYSVPNIKKGTHVIRLDQRVVPGGPFSKTKLPPSEKSEEKITPPPQKEDIKQLSSQKPPEREALIDRRQLDTWRQEVLEAKEGQDQDKKQAKLQEKTEDTRRRTPRAELLDKYGNPQGQKNKPRSQYRDRISPKRASFLKSTAQKPPK